jgi:hypothetical protein
MDELNKVPCRARFLTLIFFVVFALLTFGTHFGRRLLEPFLMEPLLYMGLPLLVAVPLYRLLVTFLADEEPNIRLLLACARFFLLMFFAFFGLFTLLTLLGPQLTILFLAGPLSLYMGLPIIVAVLLPRLVVTFLADEEPDIRLLAMWALLLAVFSFLIMFGGTTRLQARSIADNKQFVDEASNNRRLDPRQWQNNSPDRTAVTNEIWFSLALPPTHRNWCFSDNSLICTRAEEAMTHYPTASWRWRIYPEGELWQKSYLASIMLSATVAFISSLLLFTYYKPMHEWTPTLSILVCTGLVIVLISFLVP